MKRTRIVALLAATFVAAAHADLMHLDGFGAGSSPHPRIGTSRGGEFVVTADHLGTFHTYCIEITEAISIGGTYNYLLDTGARKGSTGTGFDPISFETAWLYRNFRDGTLDTLVPGFVYGDNTSSDALQEAFWVLEEEPLHGSTSAFAQLLIDSATAGAAGWTDLHGVRVLVIKDDAGGDHQDVLGLIPAPGAALLAAVGFGFFRQIRRRIAA